MTTALFAHYWFARLHQLAYRQLTVKDQTSHQPITAQSHPAFSMRLQQYPDLTTRALACWLLGQQLAWTDRCANVSFSHTPSPDDATLQLPRHHLH